MISINSTSKEKQRHINYLGVAGKVLIPYFEFYIVKVCCTACIGHYFHSCSRSLHAVLCQQFGMLHKHLSFDLNLLCPSADSLFESLNKVCAALTVVELLHVVGLHGHQIL